MHAPTLNHIWACTGNTSFRNTPETIHLLNIIIDYQNKYINKNDQECLYQYFLDNSKFLFDYFENKMTKNFGPNL